MPVSDKKKLHSAQVKVFLILKRSLDQLQQLERIHRLKKAVVYSNTTMLDGIPRCMVEIHP